MLRLQGESLNLTEESDVDLSNYECMYATNDRTYVVLKKIASESNSAAMTTLELDSARKGHWIKLSCGDAVRYFTFAPRAYQVEAGLAAKKVRLCGCQKNKTLTTSSRRYNIVNCRSARCTNRQKMIACDTDCALSGCENQK